MSHMRIAIFTGNYNYLREGANRALNKLAGYLERECGCTVRAFSPVTDTPAFEPEGTLVPVPSIALPVRSEFRLALGLPRAVRDDLDRFAPDIVHVATPDILGTRAQTWAIRHGVPQVASMHTLFETYLDYYGIGFLRPLLEAHLRRFYRRADHVLAPTPALVTQLRAIRGDTSAGAGASVWSRGIDRDLFSPARRDMAWRRAQGIADDEVAVLFFGRLVKEKGIDVFMDVLARLRQGAATGAPVRALVVGEGPARPALERIDGAVLTGHLEGEALSTAIASADILLAPSVTETFGQVMVEAMASGLAVISADAPSARAIVLPGTSGILCPPRAVGDYVAAMAVLANDTPRRLAMGAAGRERSADFSWDAASQSVFRCYRELLDARRSDPRGP